MSKKLYVGNLPWSVTSSELEDELSGMGLSFKTAEVVFDRATERSRGFAFVHFETDDEAEVARERLDGLEMGGRTLVSNMARETEGHRPEGHRSSGRGSDRDRPRGGGGYAPSRDSRGGGDREHRSRRNDRGRGDRGDRGRRGDWG